MILPLTRDCFGLIDRVDYRRLKGTPCALAVRPSGLLYVQFHDRNAGSVLLHRWIMGAPKGLEVHHINGNGLDNRRINLRIVTRQQNAAGFCKKRPGSKSRFRGVTWFPRDQNWMAKITVNYKPIYLGYHDTEEEAARAYNIAATKYFGDFAHLNDV